ncbi:Glc8 protein [Ceratocystis lukuohia]|uniref:Protein GLC8 n=3 Tax=Ceratocystis TaxID=5157 RepID=A0A0F8B8L1_CERFI|nr:putative protein C17A5.09c [Ceratocystis platani]PHH51778.1 Uncharacterized protein C17A5.09c [Ceratocystis fimbriata CBS 114723]
MPSHVQTSTIVDAQRPKGILKNASASGTLPPPPPVAAAVAIEPPQTERELTQLNTQINAGSRRSSSAARHVISRRLSQPAENDENAPRLKWDEANLYLTEQERTAKMKIDEPKTPYARHYNPDDDPSDDEIPGMDLGEPEEAVPEIPPVPSPKAVHVDESMAVGHDDDELAGMSPEEREKHRKFEEMRKKHYEMKNVAALLAHAAEDDDEDDEELGDAPPPMPALPR